MAFRVKRGALPSHDLLLTQASHASVHSGGISRHMSGTVGGLAGPAAAAAAASEMTQYLHEHSSGVPGGAQALMGKASAGGGSGHGKAGWDGFWSSMVNWDGLRLLGPFFAVAGAVASLIAYIHSTAADSVEKMAKIVKESEERQDKKFAGLQVEMKESVAVLQVEMKESRAELQVEMRELKEFIKEQAQATNARVDKLQDSVFRLEVHQEVQRVLREGKQGPAGQ